MRACWEERKKRETQEEIQGEQSRDARKRSKSVIQEGGWVEGGCIRAVVEMSRQSKQDGGERRAD